MQAFPKDSANNAIGGSGPLHKDIDHNLFHGNRGAEAFSDFSRSGTDAASYSSYSGDKTRRPSTTRALSHTPTFQRSEHSTPRAFDAIARVDPVHGDESLGLGTSTFLEGAPASRLAIKRRESESDQGLSGAGGLGRKKSLAQKIRGMNSTRQANRGAAAARVQSPTSPELPREAGEVVAPRKISSGPSTTTNSIAVRPFSSDSLGEIRAPIAEAAIEHAGTSAADYDAAYDQKGASIEMARRQGSTQSTTRQGLTRAITHDSSAAGSSAEEPVKQSGGILSRMKSLRGGLRGK